MASVERYMAERDRQLRTEWTEYHQGQVVRRRAVLESLIACHEQQAERYRGPTERSSMSTTDKMGENLKKYRVRLEEIRADWTRSDEAKRQDLQAAYEEAMCTHDRLADEYRKRVEERLGKRRSAAFSVPKVGKDPALDVLVYRDAIDRVTKTREPRELSDTLARAQMTGDAALAKVVLFRAYELQNPSLVGAYFKKYPEELPAWEEFMEAAEDHNTLETLGISGATGVSELERPEELRGVGISGSEARGGGRR